METLHIIFGGASVEHDVSIVTALQTYNALKDNYRITLLYCTKENEIYITTKTTPGDYIDKQTLIAKSKNKKDKSKNIAVNRFFIFRLLRRPAYRRAG